MTDGQIHTVRSDGCTWGLKLAEIGTIRVAYAPTRAKTNRYLATVTDRNKGKLPFDNMHFAGARISMTALLLSPGSRCFDRPCAEGSPAARLMAGASAANYFRQLFFVAASCLLLLPVIIALPIDFAISSLPCSSRPESLLYRCRS